MVYIHYVAGSMLCIGSSNSDAYKSSIISKQKINLHWYFRLTVKKAPFVIIYLDTYFPENI